MCLRRAYFDVKSPEIGEPPGKGEIERMLAGQEIGRLARGLFSGVLINTPSTDMDKAIAETQAAIATGADAVFEGAFANDRGEIRVDILQRAAEDSWHLVEVKSSKEVKPEHLTDVAFQRCVLEESGLTVSKCSLLLVSSDYVFDGKLDLDKFFALHDVTKDVETLGSFVREQSSLQTASLLETEPPDVVPNVHCVRNGGCAYARHCYRDLPANDVTTLPYIKREAVQELHLRGTRDIASIPEDVKLSDRQRLIAGVVQSGVPFVSPKLQGILEAVRFPVHFVDFEAVGTGIPLFEGVAPYQAVPFQWSDHVLDAPSTYRHREFISMSGDPREAFAQSLWEAVKDAASVVHYASYEKSILKSLVAAGIPLATDLLELFEESGVDLERIVRDHVYLAEFRGKTSIKRVYPALVPAGGYRDLTIQDGDHAAAEYKRILSPATTDEEKRRVGAELLAYCERDTLAMVEVFEALQRLANSGQ